MGNSGGVIVSGDYSVQSLIRSIGDPGATPTDQAGQTVLKRLYVLDSNVDVLKDRTRSLDGDVGTQINKSVSAAAATVIIHTVTGGKTLYLTNILTHVTGDALGIVNTHVRDGGDSILYYFSSIRQRTPENGVVSLISFPQPRIIPAGYDICVLSSAVGLTVYGHAFGWEE